MDSRGRRETGPGQELTDELPPRYRIAYWVSSGGDGSASVRFATDESEASRDERTEAESTGEGWAESSASTLELAVVDGALCRLERGGLEEVWVPLERLPTVRRYRPGDRVRVSASVPIRSGDWSSLATDAPATVVSDTRVKTVKIVFDGVGGGRSGT